MSNPETIEEHVKRLENNLLILCSALLRKGTDQDGNYGWPSFRQEVESLVANLKSNQ